MKTIAVCPTACLALKCYSSDTSFVSKCLAGLRTLLSVSPGMLGREDAKRRSRPCHPVPGHAYRTADQKHAKYVVLSPTTLTLFNHIIGRYIV